MFFFFFNQVVQDWIRNPLRKYIFCLDNSLRKQPLLTQYICLARPGRAREGRGEGWGEEEGGVQREGGEEGGREGEGRWEEGGKRQRREGNIYKTFLEQFTETRQNKDLKKNWQMRINDFSNFSVLNKHHLTYFFPTCGQDSKEKTKESEKEKEKEVEE